MAALPEEPAREPGPPQAGVERVDLQVLARGATQLAERPEPVDRVADRCPWGPGRRRPGLDEPPGQVGVLALDAGERLDVEAARPLEQRPGVEDVAGLPVGVRGADVDR